MPMRTLVGIAPGGQAPRAFVSEQAYQVDLSGSMIINDFVDGIITII
jgi:hypothetical protein